MPVLLIEENQDIRDLIQILLLDFQVTVHAVNGAEALSALDCTTYNAIICSLNLLDRPDSKALCDKIERSPVAKKIAITGHLPARAQQIEAVKLFHEIFYKPFDIKTVIRSLSQISEVA